MSDKHEEVDYVFSALPARRRCLREEATHPVD